MSRRKDNPSIRTRLWPVAAVLVRSGNGHMMHVCRDHILYVKKASV